MSFNPTDIISLYKVSGQNTWSQDGTDTPNALTNRLKLSISRSGPSLFNVDIRGVSYFGATTWYPQASEHSITGIGPVYALADFFNKPGAQMVGPIVYLTAVPVAYKIGIFQSMTFISG